MSNKSSIGRKQFLGTLSALSAAAIGFPLLSSSNKINPSEKSNGNVFSEADHLLIKGGYVLSMDEQIGDLAKGDVELKNGIIVNVGQNLDVPGASVMNAEGMIVLPGLVETHWHVWTSILRAMAGAKPQLAYFDITSRFGKLFTPDDMYLSMRLALTEAVYSGITYVHDWCHNTRSLEHARASIRAIQEEGVRARFSVGLPAGADQETAEVDMRIAESLQKELNRNDSLASPGLAWPEAGSHPAARKRELETARKLGIPISTHAGRKPGGKDAVSHIKDWLGKDMQVIHGIRTSPEELALMRKAGTSLSISPFSELRIGYGFPPVPDMLASGVNIGLSVDTFPLSGNADMFAVMKVFMNLANAISKDEFIVPGRRILELATIEGARSMGMEKEIGSLTPGKRADIILVDTRAPNMVPLIDPVMQLVTATQPANVDTVIINGKIRKLGGKLVKETEELFRNANALAERLKKEAGW